MTRVLTFTVGNDYHAGVVDYVIRALGGDNILLSTTAVPGRGEDSISFDEDSPLVRTPGGESFRLNEIDTVWNRRLSLAFNYPAHMHPVDKRHVGDQARDYLEGLAGLLIEKFAVNPLAAKGAVTSKARQLALAKRFGLQTPRTLISNDFDQIESFLNSVGRGCVKPFRLQSWAHDAGEAVATTATINNLRGISRESVALAPMIYQEFIAKAFEVRLTLFGAFYCATRINNQDGGAGAIDWRANSDYLNKLEPCSPPDSVLTKARAFLAGMGLRFGTFDFVVTADGQWIFLEVNEAGQFLWQERFCEGCFVVEPFARYLLSQDDSFVWDKGSRSKELCLSKVAEEVQDDPRHQALRSEPSLPDEVLGHADERLQLP